MSPFPPWMTRMRAPARPSLGTLGPLLQQPGLASQLGLRTPLAPIPRTALAAACPCLSARPTHPVKTAARTPARRHGSAHGPALARPFSPLSSPTCLSVLLTPSRAPPFYLSLIPPVSPVSPCSTRCLSGSRWGQCLGSGRGITRTRLHRHGFTQNASAFLQLWTQQSS